MTNTSRTEDGKLEPVLKAAGCIGPYDEVHKCSTLHCDHCGVCNVMPETLELTAAHETSLKERLLAELDAVQLASAPDTPTGEAYRKGFSATRTAINRVFGGEK